MKPFALVCLALFVCASPAFGQQQSGPGWSYPALSTAAHKPAPLPADPPGPIAEVPRPNGFPTYGPERPAPSDPLPPPPPIEGQQHWVMLNLSILQPFVGRIGVKVWPRENNSLWLEAYVGSVLFDFMAGFGVRVQHTAHTFGSGGRLMVSPGLGVHVLPAYASNHGGLFGAISHDSGVTFLVADVDLSWLHDFTPHFGFEMGVKLGIAGHISGRIGRYPRGVTFGRDCYPILALYSGFRF